MLPKDYARPGLDKQRRGQLLKDDKRWVYGVMPEGNANSGWVQHVTHYLAPTGLAGFVLANGSMASNQSGEEGEIRKAIIEADLVDCMVALPGQLFYSTQIPACLWPESVRSNLEKSLLMHEFKGLAMILIIHSRGEFCWFLQMLNFIGPKSFVASAMCRARMSRRGHLFRI